MYGQNPTNNQSSSPQRPATGGLTRFSSAPGSFLSRAVDSVMESRRVSAGSPSTSSLVGPHHQYHGHYFSGESSSSLTSESASKASPPGGGGDHDHLQVGPAAVGGGSGLVRQKSSPAGFLGHLVSDNGFSFTRGSGAGFNSHNGSGVGHGVSRLKSQLSFTGQDSLSQISEGSESEVEGVSSENRRQNSVHCYSPAGFGVEPWENGNSIAFSGPSTKRVKNVDGDFFSCLNSLETQFSMPQTALEMATMDKLLNIPEDSIPCKIRAKRGFATHPRSIAERERRTRISGKLKKLQDLVPNMDKQTSYADMLDLAVQHIKGLQNEVQKLHNEMENCTCGCKQSK